jgi:SAM-dependent methyltransferase
MAGLLQRQFLKYYSAAEHVLCDVGLMRPYDWAKFLQQEQRHLYAGDLRRNLPQYETHIGLTPFRKSPRTIFHDVTKPMPIPDNSVDRYQSEDVFEHIELSLLPAVLTEIFRVLKPGGLFRLSIPDYGFDVYQQRTSRNQHGEFLFDPVGGGRYVDGKVVGGGHVWFPTHEQVVALYEATPFATNGRYSIVQGYGPDGEAILQPIDYSLGYVQRTPDHDPRGTNPRRPISMVIDAWKN